MKTAKKMPRSEDRGEGPANEGAADLAGLRAASCKKAQMLWREAELLQLGREVMERSGVIETRSARLGRLAAHLVLDRVFMSGPLPLLLGEVIRQDLNLDNARISNFALSNFGDRVVRNPGFCGNFSPLTFGSLKPIKYKGENVCAHK